MQRLEVSGAVRPLVVVGRQRVNTRNSGANQRLKTLQE
jgi:hypothetical protein